MALRFIRPNFVGGQLSVYEKFPDVLIRWVDSPTLRDEWGQPCKVEERIPIMKTLSHIFTPLDLKKEFSSFHDEDAVLAANPVLFEKVKP